MPVTRRGKILPLSVTNFFQEIGIFVIDRFQGDVDPAARHGAIGAAERRTAFGSFGLHLKLSRLAVERVPLRKNGLYFFFSRRLGVRGLFLFRVVV